MALGFGGCQQWSFVMTPKVTACGWSGLGQVGTSDKPASDTWYNNTLGCTATVQEPGHNYGMQHSSSITCTGAPFLDTPSSCTHSEYGDKFDTMGGGCRHMNAWQKLYQKWWGGCNAIRVQSSGTYNIYPTETPCNGVQAIQVKFPNGKTRSWQSVNLTSYYLEYRASIGFDQGMAPQVLVHTGVEPILPTQTNPKGVKVWIINASGDANAPGLQAGGKFSDPGGGLDISVKSIDTTKAVVDITYGPGGGTGGDAGTTPDGGTAPDAGGGTPPTEPAICLDGMNTVFVPPGSDECVPIYPPRIPDGGGIVVIDAAPPDVATPTDARVTPDAPNSGPDAARDAGTTIDVVEETEPPPPPPTMDAGTTTPPPSPPAEDKSGCGCRLAQDVRADGRGTWGALLGLALVARVSARRRRHMRRS
jgi:gametolysin peptidase M11